MVIVNTVTLRDSVESCLTDTPPQQTLMIYVMDSERPDCPVIQFNTLATPEQQLVCLVETRRPFQQDCSPSLLELKT